MARTPDSSDINSWLVEEMYDQYREDPSSLSPSWQEFFADYRPDVSGAGTSTANGAANGAASPEAKTAKKAPAKKAAAKTPAKKAAGKAAPAKADAAANAADAADAADAAAEPTAQRLRGVQAAIVRNMEASLEVPTATSVRDVPAKLLEVNRRIVNNYLMRSRGGKVSFTHLIAFAIIKAADAVPGMKNVYKFTDDKPTVTPNDAMGLGLAIDMQKDDGSRVLMVPAIKNANKLTFAEFLHEYEEVIRKVRTNKLTPDMFDGVTITLTNPGMIGTVHSIPRLMQGQSAIIGVGALDYPAAYQAADPSMLAKLGLSKVITLTSTYDHRVIQGAESGEFLKRVHQLLLGEDGFYDELFASLGVPYEPARWRTDSSPIDSERTNLEKQHKVDHLINMYRVRGHLIADLDPLSATAPVMHPELDPIYYGLSIWDLDREFLTGGIAGRDAMPLGSLLGRMRDAYCRTIGIEYMHIQHPEQKAWIQRNVEGVSADVSADDQLHILERLNDAEAFERFLHTKYVGQKRFGLEGAESLIPLLDALLEGAADEGLDGAVLGMAHRGRLNVLTNIMGKSYRSLFREFEGDIDPDTVQGSGDVKYHLGQSGTFTSRDGKDIAITMPPNPSHLEAVNPVVEGMARAMEDLIDEPERFPILPLLLHGDAAFAGQGVVAETLNLSQLPGYRTGGTVHVVINNQVGFTTSPESSRSSWYPTDVAKMVQAPILHVNGDDPEAVVRVARLALAYRQEFKRDVVIDLVCYRKHGHNEADDPSMTQPLMYAVIDKQRSVRKLYTERLVKRGDISIEQAQQALEQFEQRLQEAFDDTKQSSPPEKPIAKPPTVVGVLPHVDTGVAEDVLDKIADKVFGIPDGFTRHPKLNRIFDRNHKNYKGGDIDWPLGETLAFGSMLHEGTTVRLAGQDSRRGTFVQRHAVLVDHSDGTEYLPLANLSDDQGKWFIYDSLLSEYAALGFEYGYAVVDRNAFVAWEAQFGDFVNGAQIIIDQFIVAAEDKWHETAGLVMLLPHGFEGQGPEHSSARIERFLTLCAEDNIQVVNATNAAQYFHVLRRQMHRDVRKPLIIFTPKSLLRSKDAISPKADLLSGHFQEVLDDPTTGTTKKDRAKIKQIVLASGKVAYDAMHRRDELETKTAIVRVEQLYPWPEEQISEILASYPNAKDIAWLQEEPANMGPWGFVDGRLWNIVNDLGGDRKLRRVSRVESASPATGSHVVHQQELEQMLRELFEPGKR